MHVIKPSLAFKLISFKIVELEIFTVIFFIFAFGWNPKVVMVDDVASKPIYATPYKFYKYFIRDKF